MTEVVRKPLLDVYGGERSWCAIYGEPLFPSEQSARAYISGDNKRELMRLGLLFIVGKRIVTDQPEALFDAIVAMKKEDSRALAGAMTDPTGVAPIPPRKHAGITPLHARKGRTAEATDA